MIHFKSIVTRIKNTITRAVGVRPSWWRKIFNQASKPVSPLQTPIQGSPQSVSLNPAKGTPLTDLEFTLLTKVPIQLTTLEKAKRDASKIYFNRPSAYAIAGARSNGISVNGAAYPLPVGIPKVHEVSIHKINS